MRLQSWTDKRNDAHSRLMVKWIILYERLADDGLLTKDQEPVLADWYRKLKQYNKIGTIE